MKNVKNVSITNCPCFHGDADSGGLHVTMALKTEHMKHNSPAIAAAADLKFKLRRKEIRKIKDFIDSQT